jgi:membrane-associated phospholipid phosphatase
MTLYRGNQTVEPGLYLNLRQFSFESVEEAKALPGTSEAIYRRVPMLALVAAAPFLGLAFVVFLPFIGFAMVAWLLGVKGMHLAADAVGAAARVVRPNWEPSLAFLNRSKRAAKTPTKDVADTWAADVEKKLDGPNGDK